MSWVPFPWAERLEKMMREDVADFLPPDEAEMPVLIRELIGRLVRLIEQGDPRTSDYVPSRVDIETREDGKIFRISFG